MQVNIHEAKTHLSRLIQRAAAGEEIVIAKAGKPMVRLASFGDASRPRAQARLHEAQDQDPARVATKKLDHVALARTSAGGERLHIPLGQWPEPTPVPAERAAGSRGDLTAIRCASKQGPRECHQQRTWQKVAECSNQSDPA
jgi:prevent-host-death family protein